jgi:hypothetical protein
MIMLWLIAVLHILVMLFNSFYAFLFKKSWFDYLYLLFVYSIVLHWTFFNGECIISYAYKKFENKDYIAGSNVNLKDVIQITNLSDSNMTIMMTIHNLLNQVSIILVVLRNKIPIHLYFIFVILAIMTYSGSKWFKSNHQNDTYLLYQEIIKYTLIAYLIYCVWRLKKRF